MKQKIVQVMILKLTNNNKNIASLIKKKDRNSRNDKREINVETEDTFKKHMRSSCRSLQTST